MQWNSQAYGYGSDEEDSAYARPSYGSSTPRSLGQQLLATGKKWEAERDRESLSQKMELADATASLKAERVKVGTLTAQVGTLKSEHAATKVASERALQEEKDKVKELTEACKESRTQALGSWLLLAELRSAILAQLPPLPLPPASASATDGAVSSEGEGEAADRPGGASKATVAGEGEAVVRSGDESAAATAVADSNGDCNGEGEAAEKPPAAESAEAAPAPAPAPATATATVPTAPTAPAAGESEATARLRVLVTAALPPLVDAAELLSACGAGKVRLVSEAIEAPQLLRETLRARAEGFLEAGLASGASWP